MEEERSFLECVGIILGAFVWITYVLDHIGLAWHMIKKKPYKCCRQSLFEDLMKYPAVAWIPIALAIGYTIWLFGLDI